MRDDTGQSVVVESFTQLNNTWCSLRASMIQTEKDSVEHNNTRDLSKQKPTTFKRFTGTQEIPQQQRDFSNPSLHLVLRACSPTCLLVCLRFMES